MSMAVSQTVIEGQRLHVATLLSELAAAAAVVVVDAIVEDLSARQGLFSTLEAVVYPQGPLGWADQVSLISIQQLLVHLQVSDGADCYGISPLIQRQVYQGKNLHG